MNDLEWLARNVHEWPKTDSYAVVWHEKGRVRVLWDCGTQNGESFTREQWLAERARLQNKPRPCVCPVWAEYMAQCSDGEWRLFDIEPTPNHSVWEPKLRWTWAGTGEVLGDWRDTLERRPERSLYEITTSNGDKYMFTDATEPKIEWRGPEDGLPAVGTKARTSGGNCTVMAVQDEDSVCVQWHDGEIGIVRAASIKPLRTEEDRAVEDMAEIINDGTHTTCVEQATKIAKTLYAAGCRMKEPSE